MTDKKDEKKQPAISSKVRTQVILEKLPWLKERFHIGETPKINTRKFDYALMERHTDPLEKNSDDETPEKVFFFTEKGESLGRLGERLVPRNPFSPMRLFGSTHRQEFFSESVVQGVRRLGKGEYRYIKYAVGLFKDKEHSSRLTVVAFPDDVLNWYKERREKMRTLALKEVEAELNFNPA